MTGVLAAYRALVAAGELRTDPEQAAAAERLDQLQTELEAVPTRGSLLWRLARRKPDQIIKAEWTGVNLQFHQAGW